MDQPPPDLVELITATRAEIGDMERRLAGKFPGTTVLGCVIVRNRLAIYCTDGPPDREALRALLMAAKSTARYLGQEMLIDVEEIKPPSAGDA